MPELFVLRNKFFRLVRQYTFFYVDSSHKNVLFVLNMVLFKTVLYILAGRFMQVLHPIIKHKDSVSQSRRPNSVALLQFLCKIIYLRQLFERNRV